MQPPGSNLGRLMELFSNRGLVGTIRFFSLRCLFQQDLCCVKGEREKHRRERSTERERGRKIERMTVRSTEERERENERERSTKGERERVLGLPSGKRNPGLDRGSLCPWPY